MRPKKAKPIQERYLQVIRKSYPEILTQEAASEFNETGQYNAVLTIDHEYIFRFPKVPEALAQLEVEACLLSSIKDFLPLEIPYPLFENLSRKQVGEAFIGYRKISGEPFWRNVCQSIEDEGIQDRLAVQLGGFLNELHHIPLTALRCVLPRMDTYAECSDIYARIRKKLFPYMRPDACQWAAQHFESFLSSPGNFEYQPVLKHGDFGPSNILYDRQTQTITGIIDFGGSGIGDPAYDFAGLLSGYGAFFLHRCTRAYPEVESFYSRILFYQGTFALLEALFGIENGDPEAFENGISMYR